MPATKQIASDGSILTGMGNGDVLSEGAWHAWFAWHPAWTIHTGWVWLARIERRFTSMSRRDGPKTTLAEYRPPPTSPGAQEDRSDG